MMSLYGMQHVMGYNCAYDNVRCMMYATPTIAQQTTMRATLR